MKKLFSIFWEHVSGRLRRRQLEKKGLVQAKKSFEILDGVPAAAEKSRTLFATMLFVLWVACAFVLVLPPVKVNEPGLVMGQTSPSACFADFDFSYVDEARTEAARAAAREAAPEIYRLDQSEVDAGSKLASGLLAELERRAKAEKDGKDFNERPDIRPSSAVKDLSQSDFETLCLLLQSEEKQKSFISEVAAVLDRGVVADGQIAGKDESAPIQVVDSKNYIRRKLRCLADLTKASQAPAEISEAVARHYSLENREPLRMQLEKMLPLVIVPNVFLDEHSTEAAKRRAAESVSPCIVQYKKGDILVKKGEVINRDSFDLSRYYQRQKARLYGGGLPWRRLVDAAALSFLLVLFNGIYLMQIHPEILRSNKLLGLTVAVLLASVAANTACIRLFDFLGPLFDVSPLLAPSVLPLALAPLILSAMVGLRAAIYGGLFVSFMAALQMDGSFSVAMTGMVLGAAAGYAVRHAPNHRTYFLRAALVITLLLPLMQLLNLWHVGQKPELFLPAVLISAANGFILAAFSLALIFILEALFQMSTDMSLLLLCDYNHPLLKKLQFEAPGTYHHSLLVSTLAEQAAHEIGANPIRARVCALFHDIGKLDTPEYFIENTRGEDSKHDDLNPEVSKLVILNHVKEGVKLARKFKLRKIIRDCIEQHHGSDLVRYFYQRARNEGQARDEEVSESDFRYPGPLPREKEVVIVSLADACEAASRSMTKPTPAKFDALIGEIFRNRIKDGQLDAAEMTFGELAKIRKSFMRTLVQMTHARIAYPKQEDEEGKDEDDLFKQQG